MTRPVPFVVFTDFDGTLTTRDLVEGLVRAFRPDDAGPIVEAIKRGTVSLKAGITRLYDLLPTDARPLYEAWVRQAAVLRPGVARFFRELRARGIPAYVVSNGLDVFVAPVLAGLVEPGQLYCNRAVFSGRQMAVEWPHPCDPALCQEECGLCKPTVMARLTPPGARTVLVGDGVTDLAAARRADVVWARDHLARELDRLGLPYRPFDTFDEVWEELSRLPHSWEEVTP
jgi:2-hydroxy-3-keto-5-methylthiopentenyl-1-phosphate phosphatase